MTDINIYALNYTALSYAQMQELKRYNSRVVSSMDHEQLRNLYSLYDAGYHEVHSIVNSQADLWNSNPHLLLRRINETTKEFQRDKKIDIILS
jgi:hypothetical protein